MVNTETCSINISIQRNSKLNSVICQASSFPREVDYSLQPTKAHLSDASRSATLAEKFAR